MLSAKWVMNPVWLIHTHETFIPGSVGSAPRIQSPKILNMSPVPSTMFGCRPPGASALRSSAVQQGEDKRAGALHRGIMEKEAETTILYYGITQQNGSDYLGFRVESSE